MRGVNKVILVGNLGKDPEIKYFESGVAKASFSLATSESYMAKSGERVDTTEWHNIVLWRGLADIAEKYLKKGDPIYLEGKIRNRSWDDADGNKKYITEIEGNNLVMLARKNSEDSNNSAPSNYNTGNATHTTTATTGAATSQSVEQPPKPQLVESTKTTVQDIEDDLPF